MLRLYTWTPVIDDDDLSGWYYDKDDDDDDGNDDYDQDSTLEFTGKKGKR